MDWIMSPRNAYIEALTLHVTVFGDRNTKELIKVNWGNEDKEETPEGSLYLSVDAQRKGYVRTEAGTGLLQARERGLIRGIMMAPWSWSSSFQNYENINFCLSYSACGTLLSQAEQTNISIHGSWYLCIGMIITCE